MIQAGVPSFSGLGFGGPASNLLASTPKPFFVQRSEAARRAVGAALEQRRQRQLQRAYLGSRQAIVIVHIRDRLQNFRPQTRVDS